MHVAELLPLKVYSFAFICYKLSNFVLLSLYANTATSRGCKNAVVLTKRKTLDSWQAF